MKDANDIDPAGPYHVGPRKVPRRHVYEEGQCFCQYRLKSGRTCRNYTESNGSKYCTVHGRIVGRDS